MEDKFITGDISNEFTVQEYGYPVVPQSEWYCELCGSDVIYKPINIKIPNWFHRQMQHLFFGFKWRKK